MKAKMMTFNGRNLLWFLVSSFSMNFLLASADVPVWLMCVLSAAYGFLWPWPVMNIETVEMKEIEIEKDVKSPDDKGNLP